MFNLLTKKMKHRKGFTLVELMVVVAIIGILAAVAIPKFQDTTASANGSKVMGDLASLDSAISMYMANNAGTAPNTLADLAPTYLPQIPTPPTGKPKIAGITLATDTAYGLSDDKTQATYLNKTAITLQAGK